MHRCADETNLFSFFLIRIHSIQGWAATRGFELKKEEEKDEKNTGNLFRKNLQIKGVCQFQSYYLIKNFNTSIKKPIRLVNIDMKYLSVWQNANNVSLNVQKTDLVTFKQKKNIWTWSKILLNRKRLCATPNI